MTVQKKRALIVGEVNTGKSTAFYGMRDDPNVLFMNCDGASKMLPFACDFHYFNITSPMQVFEGFKALAENKKFNGVNAVIIDTVTFLMEQYVTTHIVGAADGRAAWGDYAQYFKMLMKDYVAAAPCSVLMTAHTLPVRNEATFTVENKAPVQGHLSKTGIEGYFTLVVATKKMTLEDLVPYKNNLLTISPQEERLGFKHVMQVQLTKETMNDKIRSPMGMWEDDEIFINSDAQLLLDRMDQYYG